MNTDLLLPDTSSRDQDKHDLQQRLDQQKVHYDRKAKDLDTLTPSPGDQVLVHPKRLGTRVWCEGVVLGKRDEPRSYDIELTSGQKVRRNRRDLRRVFVRHVSSSVCDQQKGQKASLKLKQSLKRKKDRYLGRTLQKRMIRTGWELQRNLSHHQIRSSNLQARSLPGCIPVSHRSSIKVVMRIFLSLYVEQS